MIGTFVLYGLWFFIVTIAGLIASEFLSWVAEEEVKEEKEEAGGRESNEDTR